MLTIPQAFHTDPEILSGAAVFVGTRTPVAALLDYLAVGDGLDAFLEDFPAVNREQALAALEQLKHELPLRV